MKGCLSLLEWNYSRINGHLILREEFIKRDERERYIPEDKYKGEQNCYL